jgi:Iap family predicted aminopeptidase
MTFDEKNQAVIGNEPILSHAEYQQSYAKLISSRTEIDLEIDRVSRLMIIAQQEEDFKKVCISAHLPHWAHDAFKNNFMPVLRNKIHIGSIRYSTSLAMRYLILFAIRNPDMIGGVSVEEVKRHLGV